MSALLQVGIPESTTIVLHPTKKCVLPPGKSRSGAQVLSVLDTGQDQHLGRFQVIRLMPVHSKHPTFLSDRTSLTTRYFNRKLHQYQPSVLNKQIFRGWGYSSRLHPFQNREHKFTAVTPFNKQSMLHKEY